ncbi:hypothetical protein HNY73_011983 [Argiope bruennichi]|uniref:Uncharacterized protein n=1 Tax=Argiope bruennichi TaxID=94029 RepID=A0A8T0ETP0_ARGBR|nr:hypothetical protein HNY73_011983 [Argiope bruennichi]
MPHRKKCPINGTFSHFLRYFRCTGLLSDSEKNITFHVISFIFILATIDSLVLGLKSLEDAFYLKMTLPYLSCDILSVFIWFSMRRRRCNLKSLLRILSKTQKMIFTWKEAIFFCVTCCVPFLFSGLKVVQRVVLHKETPFSIYGFNVTSTSGIIFIFVRSSLWFFIYPTSVNLVVLLYCFLCRNFCRQINELAQNILKCSARNFTPAKQVNIFVQETRIEDLLQLTQEVFSVPSFLILAAHFCSSIAVLGDLIYNADFFYTDYFFLSRLLLLFLNSSVGLLACLWTAGGLPLAENQLKDAFRRKKRERFFLFGKENEEYFQKELMDKPSFMMSGCGIVYLQRSSILTLLGTVFTFTALLITDT